MPDSNWKELFSAIREEEWDDAILSIDGLIKKEPSDPEHFVKLGDLYVNGRNFHGAVLAYRKALGFYKQAHDTAKAIMICKKILELEPADRDMAQQLDDLLAGHKKNAPLTIQLRSGQFEGEGTEAGPADERLRKYIGSEHAPELLKLILSHGGDEILKQLAVICFKPGDQVIREGEAGDSLFIILSGAVEISSRVQGRQVGLASLMDGDIFGEMGFLSSKPRTATVTAITDLEIVEVIKPVLDMVIERKPDLLRHLYNVYISRMDMTLAEFRRSAGGSLAGSLKELALPDLMQVFEQTRKEGVLSVTAEGGSGRVSFREGMVEDMSFRDLRGEDALVELLLLRDGSFHYENKEVGKGAVSRPVGFLLMEGARLIDEQSALKEHMPEGGDILELTGSPDSGDHDMNVVAACLQKKAQRLGEAAEASGLSRIRAAIAAAKLRRGGLLQIRSKF
ncbi:MAG: cyclic nucleotide-binding domain-containing protein [Nitrospirae bacterium]|nr:MAG: cyclic nucleotide-binding domain-containing protein [Nitrospirota bacterium]